MLPLLPCSAGHLTAQPLHASTSPLLGRIPHCTTATSFHYFVARQYTLLHDRCTFFHCFLARQDTSLHTRCTCKAWACICYFFRFQVTFTVSKFSCGKQSLERLKCRILSLKLNKCSQLTAGIKWTHFILISNGEMFVYRACKLVENFWTKIIYYNNRHYLVCYYSLLDIIPLVI